MVTSPCGVGAEERVDDRRPAPVLEWRAGGEVAHGADAADRQAADGDVLVGTRQQVRRRLTSHSPTRRASSA